MLEDVVVAEAQHHQPVGRHDRIANTIMVLSSEVGRAIGFDHQPSLGTVEVRHVETDGLLAPELQPGKTTVAQQLPERALRRRRLRPKPPRSVRLRP